MLHTLHPGDPLHHGACNTSELLQLNSPISPKPPQSEDSNGVSRHRLVPISPTFYISHFQMITGFRLQSNWNTLLKRVNGAAIDTPCRQWIPIVNHENMQSIFYDSEVRRNLVVEWSDPYSRLTRERGKPCVTRPTGPRTAAAFTITTVPAS